MENESMENEDYRIIFKNGTMIKCFRDGRIFTKCNVTSKHGKKGEWIERSNNPHNITGYIRITIGGKLYYLHRLIMEAFEGESDQHVDHIDRNKTNNNYENLHYCTRSENQLNRDYVDNSKGYYWDKQKQKWRVRIGIDGKQIHLGYFDNEEDAKQVAQEARAKRHRK
jgi:hypothetical protein